MFSHPPSTTLEASTLYISLFYIHLFRLFVGFPCVISMFYKKHLENIRPSVTLVLHAKYDFNMSCTCEISIIFSARSVRIVEFDNGMLFPVIHQ